MICSFHHKNKLYRADISKPIDISICIRNGEQNPKAFHAPDVQISAVKADGFIGDINQGGFVNYKNIQINPHGNGTHTECVGHISKETYTINQCLKQFMFLAQVVSVKPEQQESGDWVIMPSQLMHVDNNIGAQAIVIRTIPNEPDKESKNYSDTNPAYIHHESVAQLVYRGFEHLLTDLPSVDRERDDAKFLAHKAFWKYPGNVRKNATITEMIYVDNEIKDGFYLLQLQVLNIDLDASPSRPVLYEVLDL